MHFASLLLPFALCLLLFSADLLKAAPHVRSACGESSGTALLDDRQHRPSLNASSRIKYDDILRKYMTDGPRCSELERRIEWRELTADQRHDWIKAVWCLTTRPSKLASTQSYLTGRETSLLDDFALLHVRSFYTIHYVSNFLPWHRLLVYARELAMKQECGYTGPTPYWNWAIDADTGNLQSSPVLSDEYGVGGNGTGPNGTVVKGPFAYFPLSYKNSPRRNQSAVSYEPHHLGRTFGVRNAHNYSTPMAEYLYNTSAVRRVLTDSGDDFTKLWPLLEGLQNRTDIVGAGPHSGIHLAFGADMVTSQSPADPIFFLHHAQVDRIWWSWQIGDLTGNARAPPALNTSDPRSRVWAYGGHTVEYLLDPAGGPRASLFDVQMVEGLMSGNLPTYKLMDITRPPLCYTYD